LFPRMNSNYCFKQHRNLVPAYIMLLCASVAGCGDRLESTVTGTVTYQGSPLESAIIDFQNASKGPSAAGYTDAGGNFTLFTGGTKGLLSGPYKAAVTAPQGSDVPVKYCAPATSELEYDVTPGKNTINIHLQ